MTPELLRKFARIQKAIEKEKGPLVLFALVRRQDSGLWDVVLSASWFDKSEIKTLRYIVKTIKARLTRAENLQISHVDLLAPEEPFVKAVNGAFTMRDSLAHLDNCILSGVPIEHAYILASSRAAA